MDSGLPELGIPSIRKCDCKWFETLEVFGVLMNLII